MPKNNVTDLITDQEIAFARLVLSGTMTDRAAARAAGLAEQSAAYIKAKPRVRAWMHEHRALQQQQQTSHQEEEHHRLTLTREQVLGRLWQIANLPPEATRGSVTSQIKALSMIVAIESLIPDRRAAAEPKPAPPVSAPQIYKSAWLRQLEQEEATAPPDPVPAGQTPHPAPASAIPHDPLPPPIPAQGAGGSPLHSPVIDAKASPWEPPLRGQSFVPDSREPFHRYGKPSGRPR